MKEVISSKGSKVVYDLLVSCNILESCVSLKEIDPSDSIGFIPKDAVTRPFNTGVTQMLNEQGYEIPTVDGGHHGGMRMGYVNTKGYGEVEILLDFNEYFVFEYTKQEVQLDYGRVPKETMQGWLNAFVSVLNSSKSLKKTRMKVKDEFKDTYYQSDTSFYSSKPRGQSESE